MILVVAAAAAFAPDRSDPLALPRVDPLRVLIECDSRCRGPNDRLDKAHIWYSILGLYATSGRGVAARERQPVPVGTWYTAGLAFGYSTGSEIRPGASCRDRLAATGGDSLETIYAAQRPGVCILAHGANDVSDARAALGDVPGVNDRVVGDLGSWAARVAPYCGRVIVSTLAEHTGQVAALPYYVAINDRLQAGELGPGVQICDLSAMPSSGFPLDDLPHPEVLADQESEGGWMRPHDYSVEGEAWMGRALATCIRGRSFNSLGAEVYP